MRLALLPVLLLVLPAALALTYDLSLTIPNPYPDANDYFGDALAVSGQYLIVGAYGDGMYHDGAVLVFNATSGSKISQVSNPGTIDAFFGLEVAPASPGFIVSAPFFQTAGIGMHGRAYWYDASGAQRRVFDDPAPYKNDGFGYSLATTANHLIIGERYADVINVRHPKQSKYDVGAIHVYDAQGAPQYILLNPDLVQSNGWADALAAYGGRVLVGNVHNDVGSPDAGAAFLVNLDNATVTHVFYNPEPDALSDGERFGTGLAMDSRDIVIGAPRDMNASLINRGSVYVYDANTFQLRLAIRNPHPPADFDFFGQAVLLAHDRIFVSAPLHTVANVTYAGTVYVFDRNGTLVSTINNPRPERLNSNGDMFGMAMGADNGAVFIGSPDEDSSNVTNSGAVFSFIEPVPPADTTPPAIFSVVGAPSSTTARITWTTDEPATSIVHYGTIPGVLNSLASGAGLVTGHDVPVDGLSPGNRYYYSVESADGASNTGMSGVFSFLTPTGGPKKPAPSVPVAMAYTHTRAGERAGLLLWIIAAVGLIVFLVVRKRKMRK